MCLLPLRRPCPRSDDRGRGPSGIPSRVLAVLFDTFVCLAVVYMHNRSGDRRLPKRTIKRYHFWEESTAVVVVISDQYTSLGWCG